MAILLLVGVVVGSRCFRSFGAVAVPGNSPRPTPLLPPPLPPVLSVSLSVFVFVAREPILPQLGRPRSGE